MVGENDGMRTYFTGLKSTVVLAGETVYALTLCAGEGRFQDGTAQCSLSLAWQDPLTDLPVPENGDKLFCGWYKDADCTKPYTEETMPASDLNLYAGWDIDVYTVTLNLMGGEMDHPLVFRARAGTQPVAALVPALTDRSFTGWYTDRYATTLFSGVMPACDVTLYAGYIKSGLNGEYSVANGEATLIRYQMVEHENTTLYLPETVDGVPLTGIAAGAFSGEAVEVLYLPASLTYIDPRAFSGMGNLARFEVRPGSNAFTAVDGVLYSLDGSTIVHYPPQHGTVFTMPAVVTSVGAYAFADAPLTAVNFSAALQNIGSHAFSGTALRSVTLPDSVRVIDDYAFSGCSALSLVMFDGEPESIGSDCFFGSSGQMMVFGPVYGADGVTLSVPADYAKANQISYNYYTLTLISDSANHWQVQTGQPMELPDDAEVGENAYFGGWYTSADFSGEPVSADALMPQSSLTLYAKAVPVYAYERVTADDGTQTLMITAWDPACGDIAPVVPGSIDGVDVTAIAAGCFPMDAMSITVPECVTTLSDGWVPEGWSGEIIAPAGSAAAIWAESNGLTVAAPLYKLSFVVNGGAGIESVAVGAGALLTLPEPVRTGYDFALWHMDEALTTVAALDEYGQYTMPAADTVLYASWVMNDESAATLSFTYIETMDGTITITGLAEGTTALVIPETLHGLPVTAIADHAFAYETELISVVIPGSIVAIPDSAFTGCSALTGVVLSEGVQTLGKDCFSMCTALATIDLPATLTTIGSGALRSTAITGLHLPVGLTSIASDALNGCRSLAAITVAEGNAFYASIDGVLYDLVDAKLVRYPAARAGSVYAVDDTACVIGSHAFAGAKLSTITLPETVLSLEEGAFAGFTALTQLPGFTSSLLTMIPDSAFAGCRGLTEIVIPDTIVSIGDGAFSDCTLLRAATIPVSVVSIGAKAFDPTVILYGTSGSAAEAYADEYGLLFIDPDVTVLPDCITLSVDAMTLARGETAVLTAALLPENATETSIIWYSSDNSVVSVSSDGALRALSSGEAVVTAATLNGLSASCTVTVTSGIPVDSITLNTGAIFLSEGSQEQLNAYLMPANATELDLMWYSDDEGVATVNDVGLVNAVSGGTTTIRATTMSGLTAMCSVTVPIRVQELTLSCPGTFYPGDTAAVTALITPVDAYDQSLIWSVSPASLATISADGMVSFLAPGYVTVTATAADYGTVTASLELECLADKVYILPAALTVIADEAFAGTPLQCVVIPDGVISIGANAFAGCTGLYKAVIPEDVAFIDDTAFAGCIFYDI